MLELLCQHEAQILIGRAVGDRAGGREESRKILSDETKLERMVGEKNSTK